MWPSFRAPYASSVGAWQLWQPTIATGLAPSGVSATALLLPSAGVSPWALATRVFDLDFFPLSYSSPFTLTPSSVVLVLSPHIHSHVSEAPPAAEMSTGSSSPAAKAPGGYFQCGLCTKHYNRADHLIRHVRSHTREKPYVCHVCDKGFSRPDLMKRHAAAHGRDGVRKPRPSVVEHVRVSHACKSCAASKLKCDEDKPCQRCREKDLICDWRDHPALARLSPEPLEHQALNYRDSGQPPALAAMPEAAAASPTQPRLNATTTPIDNYALASPLSPYDARPAISPTDRENGIFSIDGTFFPDFIPGSLLPSLSRSNEMNPGLSLPLDNTHFGGFNNFNLQLDFDLTDVDYGLIDFFNTNGVNQGIHSNNDPADDADSEIALGVEAFHRSSLSAWKPNHRDHAFADQESLSVSAAINSPESNISRDRQILCECLMPNSRDVIFGMVLYTSNSGNMARIMKSFPSTELLDSLIQDYFVFQRQQVLSWIHCPTFQPNSEGPEVLTALAAAGATLSPILTIRKLGFALMEIARVRLPVMYETDNSVTRDLRPSQAFALTTGIGLWSGNGRETEIAESSIQHIVTMLRRALRYRRSTYPSIVPVFSDADQELEKKWRNWVDQESWKRLVYHIFLHDSQAAITLHINPVMSYADLELPLPCPRQLWEARSAIEWKEIYLSLGPLRTERLPSLADLLQEMSQLRAFQDRIDTHAAAFILLHGIAALIMEYHRLKFISKGQSKHWNALLISSRHQELCASLQYFRAVCSALNDPPRPEIDLVCEATSIFLYASLEDLQLFAGKEDKNEARRVYHSALEWINSVDSRRAIWHAGQTVRAAKAIPAASLCGFLAITVYHASLAFWSYSVVSRTKIKGAKATAAMSGSSPQSITSPTEMLVFLDAEETPDVQRFISLACGDPALQGLQGSASLVSDANLTMHVIQGVLRKDAPNEALQPLVLSLCQLMRDLGNAAGGRKQARGNGMMQSGGR